MTTLVLKILFLLYVSNFLPSTQAFGFGFNFDIKFPFFGAFFGSGGNNKGEKTPDPKDFNAAFDSKKMPLTLSEFWGWALRKKYGYKTHFIPGVVPSPAFASNGAAPSGPFVGAIMVAYGASSSANPSQIQIATKVLNYAYFNLDLSIVFEFDAQRESNLEGRMYTLNPKRAIQNFTTGMVPSNYDSIRAAYKRDPEKFIDDYLDLFYPAAIEVLFNVKIRPNQWNKLSSKLLVSHSYVTLAIENMELNKKSNKFSLGKNVQLVEYDSRKVVFTMTGFNTIMMHGKGSEMLCEGYDDSKSFVTYIKEVFEKYGSKTSNVLSFLTEYIDITTINWSLNYKFAYGTSVKKLQGTTNQNSLNGGSSGNASEWGNSGSSANSGTHTKITVTKHTKIMQNGEDKDANVDANKNAASSGVLQNQKTNEIKPSSTGASSPPAKAPVAPPKPKPTAPTKPTTTTTPKPFKSDTFAV